MEATNKKCSDCDISFASNRNLKRHVIHIHEGEMYPLDERKAECKICGKSLKQQTIKRHEMSCINKPIGPRDPTGERIVDCNICGKSMKQRCINSHEQQSHNTEPFKCDHCEAILKYKSSLNKHIIQVHGIANKNSSSYAKKRKTIQNSKRLLEATKTVIICIS